MKTFLQKTEIQGLDVELANRCNLRCPLCLSQLIPNFMQKNDKKIFLDIDYLINEMELMPDLKVLSIAGDASEPTLHPDLFKLLDYSKSRENLYTELYTNASLHNEQFWKDLAGHFSKNSIVYFTICGTTQELHEKYRVGSNLDTVIKNAMIFKNASLYPNDHMQYIKFEYNKDDNMDKIMSILTKFSTYGFVETDPIWERLHLDTNDTNNGVCSTKLFAFRYKMMLRKAKMKSRRNIICHSFDEKYVRMDSFGRYSPCVCYLLNNQKDAMIDGKIDYQDILTDKCSFCYECDNEVVKFMEQYERDSFYVC
jgi:MoaA/NifB/PqqE/SkfB family radical SAM enzyme